MKNKLLKGELYVDDSGSRILFKGSGVMIKFYQNYGIPIKNQIENSQFQPECGELNAEKPDLWEDEYGGYVDEYENVEVRVISVQGNEFVVGTIDGVGYGVTYLLNEDEEAVYKVEWTGESPSFLVTNINTGEAERTSDISELEETSKGLVKIN